MVTKTFGRREVPKSIRELMKRGIDDPRTVPIPGVTDTTVYPINMLTSGQILTASVLLIDGIVSPDVTISGQTLTASASLIDGIASGTTPVPDNLLMEDGSYVLQETDDRIILEVTIQNAVLMESSNYVLREDDGQIILENITSGTALLDVNGDIILDVDGNTIFGV